MNVQCAKCSALNRVPDQLPNAQFQCYNCGAFLPRATPPPGDTSTAVGLVGGAMLGAAIAGPPGALIGAIIGAILGAQAKGVG